MTHKSKVDWCAWIAIGVALVMLVVWADYFIAGPMLLILFLCAYPHSYETGPRHFSIRDALTRRIIPYEAISSIEPCGPGMRINYGVHSSIVIAPADRIAFLKDLAAHCSHLARRGEQLIPKDLQIAYSFSASRRLGGQFSR
jgi:hypothetical protein